ncbi:Uncharacterised protein [Mycobacterium tuberculosis]|nr:Uncharacterised protein [Mycobacterium tuberculosis]
MLLIGVGLDEHPVDVDDIPARIGSGRPRRGTRFGAGCLNAGQRIGVDGAQGPPRRRDRRYLAEQLALISQYPQIGDRRRAVGDGHR